jgi:hypothetical protein
MDPVLEQRYRNRASLPPAERAAVEEAYAAAMAEYETKYRTGSSPADLDPVESSATPITVEPTVGAPKKKPFDPVASATGGQLYDRGQIVDRMRVDGMDRLAAARMRGADPDLSVDNDVDQNAVSIVAQRLMSAGMDRASAQAQAREYVLLEKQNVRDWMNTPRAPNAAARAAEARQSRFEEDYGVATGAPSDSGLAGFDGVRDWSNWSPGSPLPPMAQDGSVLADNARRAREAERVATNSRERNEAIGKKYGPQAQEIAEAGDARGVTDYNATRKPINQQRLDKRRALEAAVDAGVGGAQSELRELNNAGAASRKEFREKLAATPDAQAAKAERARRQAAWRAQSMLAGGQPTGGPRGTKAAANAWTMMGDQGLTDDQRSSLRYMLPGGQLAAGVDAQNMQNANDVIKRFMTSGAAAGMNNPLAQAQAEMAGLQAQAERDKLRSGDEDILGEKYAPSGWLGYDEFTIEEQQQMYDDLIAQGYKPGESQRAVDRQANKRRATTKRQWNNSGE